MEKWIKTNAMDLQELVWDLLAQQSIIIKKYQICTIPMMMIMMDY